MLFSESGENVPLHSILPRTGRFGKLVPNGQVQPWSGTGEGLWERKGLTGREKKKRKAHPWACLWLSEISIWSPFSNQIKTLLWLKSLYLSVLELTKLETGKAPSSEAPTFGQTWCFQMHLHWLAHGYSCIFIAEYYSISWANCISTSVIWWEPGSFHCFPSVNEAMGEALLQRFSKSVLISSGWRPRNGITHSQERSSFSFWELPGGFLWCRHAVQTYQECVNCHSPDSLSSSPGPHCHFPLLTQH